MGTTYSVQSVLENDKEGDTDNYKFIQKLLDHKLVSRKTKLMWDDDYIDLYLHSYSNLGSFYLNFLDTSYNENISIECHLPISPNHFSIKTIYDRDIKDTTNHIKKLTQIMKDRKRLISLYLTHIHIPLNIQNKILKRITF